MTVLSGIILLDTKRCKVTSYLLPNSENIKLFYEKFFEVICFFLFVTNFVTIFHFFIVAILLLSSFTYISLVIASIPLFFNIVFFLNWFQLYTHKTQKKKNKNNVFLRLQINKIFDVLLRMPSVSDTIKYFRSFYMVREA